MSKTGKPSVFFCHAKEDANEVRKIYNALIDLKVEAWFDEENLLPGQKWRETIPQVMEASDFILVFFSSNSISKRGYVQKELKIALDIFDEFPEDEIFIIPVRLDDCKIPFRFKNLQYCDLFESNGFEKVLKSIQNQWHSDLGFSTRKYNIKVNQQLLIDGYKLLKETNYKEAEQKVDLYGKNNNHTPDYWYWKARIALALRNEEVGLIYLDKALNIVPQHSQSLALKIKTLLLKGGIFQQESKILAGKSVGISPELDVWIKCLRDEQVFTTYLITEFEIEKYCQFPGYAWEQDIS